MAIAPVISLLLFSGLMVLLISCSCIAAIAGASSGESSIGSWCSETPHPQLCDFYLQQEQQQQRSQMPNNHPTPQDRSDFRQMLLQATIAQAITAQAQVEQLEDKCNSPSKKSVWWDCYELYNDIILQLNRTLDGLGTAPGEEGCSDFDAQTWLSAALTNIQTCGLGFEDLKISDFISTDASTQNLTQLISNSLAVNQQIGQTTPHQGDQGGDGDGFPSWVNRKLLQSLPSVIKIANVVVAKDGSGHFRTIQAAINYAAAAKRKSSSTHRNRFIIYVKKGVYKEYINVRVGNDHVMIVGDGMRDTIITGSRSVAAGYTTFSCATAGIEAMGFIARGITFSNTAGPHKGQAVALRSASDLSVFYQCSIQGYQDTLFVLSQRQFYKQCYIYGTIDFIFGNAAVVFQNCIIYVRKPLHGQANVITAQGRNDPYQNTGISIHNSQVLAAPDLVSSQHNNNNVKTYLGRPWMRYSRTVFIKTYIGSLVNPLGWSTWDGTNHALNTLYYGEYNNYGPGAPTAKRVRWKGYRVIHNANVASLFTVGRFIAGGSWLPATGTPFTSGL